MGRSSEDYWNDEGPPGCAEKVRIDGGSKKLVVRKRVRRVQDTLGEVEGRPEMGNGRALGDGASFAREDEDNKKKKEKN